MSWLRLTLGRATIGIYPPSEARPTGAGLYYPWLEALDAVSEAARVPALGRLPETPSIAARVANPGGSFSRLLAAARPIGGEAAVMEGSSATWIGVVAEVGCGAIADVRIEA